MALNAVAMSPVTELIAPIVRVASLVAATVVAVVAAVVSLLGADVVSVDGAAVVVVAGAAVVVVVPLPQAAATMATTSSKTRSTPRKSLFFIKPLSFSIRLLHTPVPCFRTRMN